MVTQPQRSRGRHRAPLTTHPGLLLPRLTLPERAVSTLRFIYFLIFSVIAHLKGTRAKCLVQYNEYFPLASSPKLKRGNRDE